MFQRKSFYLFFKVLLLSTFASEDIFSCTLEKRGDFLATFYWIALEKETGEPKTKALLDIHGNTLAHVSESFWKSIRLEGTGRLLDNRILNFHQFKENEDGSRDILFRVCPKEAAYGYGYENRPLVPFRTIAVDPEKIPLDSWIFIPQAKGALLPDGAIHDGFFRVLDVGSAIQGFRIDLFTSFGDQSAVFRRNGIRSGENISVYVCKK